MIESLLTALRHQSGSSGVASSSSTRSATTGRRAAVSSLPTAAAMAFATGEMTSPADDYHNAGLTTRLPPRVNLPTISTSANVAMTSNMKEETVSNMKQETTKTLCAPRRVKFDPSPEIKIFEQHQDMENDQGDSSCSSDNEDSQQQQQQLQLLQEQEESTSSPPKRKRSTTWSTKSCWFSAQDFLEMDSERQETVVAYQSNSLLPDQHCIRGLEVFISDNYFNQKAHKRLMAQEQILTEQQRQRLLGVHHPDSFRILSSVFSKWAVDSARDFGLADAVDACIIFNEASPQNNNGETTKEEEEVSCSTRKKRKLS